MPEHCHRRGVRGDFRRLLPYISPYRWKLLAAILMVVLTNVAMAISPRVEGMITTQLAADAKDILAGVQGAGVDFRTITRILVVLAVLYATKTLTQIFGIFLLTNSIQQSMHDLRGAVQEKIRRLPVRYFDTHLYGDVLSRITNDIDTVSNALQQTLTQIVSGVLAISLAMGMMFSMRWQLALCVLLIIPLGLLITRIVVGISQKKFKAQQDALGDLNGAITEMYTGYNEIMLYGRQKEAVRRFRSMNERLRGHAFSAQFTSSLMSPLISLVTYLTIGTVAVAGSLFAISGGMKLGDLQAFIRYIWQVNDPISQVSQLSSQIQAAFAALRRVCEVLEEEEELPVDQPAALPCPVHGEVVFDNVSFGYQPGHPIIRDLNIRVESGQMVAIVGPTGAGKTTLINLLLRFYDVDAGSIRVDGVDIRDLRREDLRSMFAMVLQDTWLFSGSIYDNLRYGRLDARKDEIVAAAKTANVHHFIRTMPDGYNMVIDEEGGNISQGEKQLLTIARAILKDPQILILDEATSSVDTRLERMLQDAMSAVMKGRTSFVIAHRLSTIRSADLILVLRDGAIVEQGTHESLMKRGGYYAQLYNSQFADPQEV